MTIFQPPDTSGAHLAYVATVVRICQLAPTIVTLYDHLITLDREIELVWKKPWTIAKILFLWNRYFGSTLMIAQATVGFIKPSSYEVHIESLSKLTADALPIPQSCNIWFTVLGWSMAVAIWSMQSIMLSRLFAMYHQCQTVAIACLFSYAAEIVVMALILSNATLSFDALIEPYPGFFVCTSHQVPPSLYGFWIPVIVFDCSLCGLSLRVCLLHVRNLRGIQLSRSSMWEVLLVDTILYFSITITAYIASMMMWFFLPPQWINFPQGFSVAATCVMGVRLILNLRKTYYLYSTGDLDLRSTNRPSRHRGRPSSRTDRMIPLQDMIFMSGNITHRVSEALDHLPSTALERTFSVS